LTNPSTFSLKISGNFIKTAVLTQQVELASVAGLSAAKPDLHQLSGPLASVGSAPITNTIGITAVADFAAVPWRCRPERVVVHRSPSGSIIKNLGYFSPRIF
jgi:hypothetical protein